jgi:hypothetical protein
VLDILLPLALVFLQSSWCFTHFTEESKTQGGYMDLISKDLIKSNLYRQALYSRTIFGSKQTKSGLVFLI